MSREKIYLRVNDRGFLPADNYAANQIKARGLKPGYGMVIQFIPRSLSFEVMDEDEFNAAARGICRTIAERYWPTLSPEAIDEMAESFVTGE